ncbi:hypothetical protein IT411_03085 [Candidatus Peregrinibacteria bacterium]|nr:hypothetical protein [Candidatus Peregrinibacteria bacterium]
MIYNCLNCGIAISTKKENCPHCKISNQEAISHLSGKTRKTEYFDWKEKLKGSILTLVTR